MGRIFEIKRDVVSAAPIEDSEAEAQPVWENSQPFLDLNLQTLSVKPTLGEQASVLDAPQRLRKPKEPKPLEKSGGFFDAWETSGPLMWDDLGRMEESSKKILRVYKVGMLMAKVKAASKKV